MKTRSVMMLWITCCLCIITSLEAARILAIIPFPSYSHQIPYRLIWATLSKRGHEVIVLTTNPMNNSSLTNLTEIDLKDTYTYFDKFKINYVHSLKKSQSWFSIFRDNMWPFVHEITKTIYEHPQVRKLYVPNSDEKFDLVIVHNLASPSLYALAHRFNAPLIGVSSLPMQSYTHYILGSPVLSSHPSTWELESDTGFNLPLWQRTKNFIRQWYHIYKVIHELYPAQQALAEKYLGKHIPNIADMERNMSLVLINQQEALSFVRPKPSNIIIFGSFHVSKTPASLPKDLEKFLSDVPNGFIYVSLGTNVNMISFPEHIQNMFLDVFANLPYKVVWKYTGKITNKSDNIYTASWFSQQSILAHPNIKLFVYQGGLQSTEEAVHYAVPLVGLPVSVDQYAHVFRMVHLGVAKYLNVMETSKEILNATIMEVISDKRYKERMLKVKALNDDKPYDVLENVIWWIEFVIRHKGAPHLASTIAHEPWHQRYDTDVIAILSISLFLTLICALLLIYKVVYILKTLYCSLRLNSKKKIN